MGGPHILAASRETLQKFDSFDIAVVGPGEIIMPKLIRYIKSLEKVQGIVFRQGNELIENSRIQIGSKSSSDIIPAYNLLYRHPSYYAHNVRTQNGCPYECCFCAERQTWRGKNSIREVGSVLQEMDILSSSPLAPLQPHALYLYLSPA